MLETLLALGLTFFALALVLLNSFFVAAEFSIVKVRSTQIEERAAQGDLRARVAQRILKNLDAYLSVTQLGITLASLGLGWIGKPAFARLIEPVLSSWGIWSTVIVNSISITVAFCVITLLHIVVGELIPKTIAIQSAEKVALFVAIPLWLLNAAFYPLLVVFNFVSNHSLKLLGYSPAAEQEMAHSEGEMLMIVEAARRAGRISPQRAELLRRYFNFPHRTAKQIMVARNEVNYLTLERSFRENLEVIQKSGHTRLPLCEKGLDTIVGLINTKDLLWSTEEFDGPGLLALKRDALYVPESKSLEDLLVEFQQRHVHLAIVVDEYGVMAGVVTLEDVIEELVGEIQDEYDRESPRVQDLGDGSFRIDGGMSLHEFAQRFGLAVEKSAEATVAGLVLSLLGRMARVGDRVEIDGRTLEVTKVIRRRIRALRLSGSRTPAADPPPASS